MTKINNDIIVDPIDYNNEAQLYTIYTLNVLTIRQHQSLISQFGNLSSNKQVQVQNMIAAVNYVLRLFKGNINNGYL